MNTLHTLRNRWANLISIPALQYEARGPQPIKLKKTNYALPNFIPSLFLFGIC